MTPQRPETTNRSPRTPRATEKEGLWLAALVVRLQFHAAPESGGRQPQHPSRIEPLLSLCALILHPNSRPRTPQSPCVYNCLCRNSWHCDAATPVRLSGPLLQQSAARTLQRLSFRLPLPQQLARRTPRRLEVERTEVPEHISTRHDAQEERSITMYGTCRRDWKAMVGGGGRWSPTPSIVALGGLAIANHLTRHDAHDHVSRRRDASDAGNQSPRAPNVQEETGRKQQIVHGDA